LCRVQDFEATVCGEMRVGTLLPSDRASQVHHRS
jgi:hypothetical protein